MDNVCPDCRYPLISLENDVIFCPKCLILGNKEAFEKPETSSAKTEIILDRSTINKLEHEFESQPCPNCGRNDQLNRVDSLLMYCRRCNGLYGFDDSSDIMEITNFVPFFSAQEFIEGIKDDEYSVAFECDNCKNSDPNFVEIRGKELNSDEGHLYCKKCGSSSMSNVYDAIQNLPDTCDCDHDPSIVKFSFNEYGDIVKAECKECKRCIEISDSFDQETQQRKEKTKWYYQGSYSGRVKVDSLDLIEPGSHIAWHQPFGYWHHAIVTDIYRKNNRIKVIHYNGPNFPMKGVVMSEEMEIDFKKICYMYRVDYHDPRYSNDEAIKRAEGRLGESKYNILTNNCEHFVHYCKMGVSYSQQVTDFLNCVASNLSFQAIKGAAQTAAKVVTNRLVSTFLAKYAIKIIPIVNIASTIAALGYEVFDTYTDIKKAAHDRKEGAIDRPEFIKVIVKRVCRTLLVSTAIVLIPATGMFGMLGSFLTGLAVLVMSGIGCAIGRNVTN